MRLLHYLEIRNFKRFGDTQRIELDHPAPGDRQDPTTYTRPWTVLIPLMGTTDRNIGMDGILAGHRAEEREAAGGSR